MDKRLSGLAREIANLDLEGNYNTLDSKSSANKPLFDNSDSTNDTNDTDNTSLKECPTTPPKLA